MPTNFRQLLRWTWLGVIAVLLYSGWIVYSRYADTRRIDQSQENRRAKSDREIVEKLGSGQLKLLMFYANPPVLKAGKAGLLCYGVSNATQVRIEPPVAGVGVALSRCVEVRPRVNTAYTLIASDGSGNEARQEVTVQIAR
ncbi:MAG: hypothetical protein WKF37_04510 [Bryobacteraceae bacterium]